MIYIALPKYRNGELVAPSTAEQSDIAYLSHTIIAMSNFDYLIF